MKKYFRLLRLVFIAGCMVPLLQSSAESIIIKDVPGILPVSLDIPPDWEKRQVIKRNGVIMTLKQGNSQIEIRSFVSPNMDMDYIINAKAARLYANSSYTNLLLDKSEETGKLLKRTLFWKIMSQSKVSFEKTFILQYEDNIVILTCTAPEMEYRNYRVIFENAVLSLKFDVENLDTDSKTEIEKKPEPAEMKADDDGTRELIRDIEDKRENKANKMEKLIENEDVQ